MYNISRIDSNRTHCWFLRFYPGNGRKVISFSFSDKKYGGKENALIKAQKFRDSFSDIYFIGRKPFKTTLQSNNKTGVIGISRSYTTKKYNGNTYYYHYYRVDWIDIKGRKKNKKFFDNQHDGTEKAFLKAIKFRLRKIDFMNNKKSDFNLINRQLM